MKRLPILMILLIGLLVFAGCSSDDNDTNNALEYTLTVNVADSSGAVEGATVTIDGTTATTDANGIAQVVLTDGNYTVEVSATGYETVTEAVVIDGDGSSKDITLTESTDGGSTDNSTNLITNGDFETELGSEWETWSDAGAVSLAIGNGELVADVTATGGNTYDPKLFQSGITLVDGTDYILRFDARADVARDIVVNIGEQLDADPWFNDIGGNHIKSLNTEMQTYTVEFTADMSVATTGDLIFELGTGEATKFYIDNVSLKEVQAQKPAEYMLTTTVRDSSDSVIEGATVTVDGIDSTTDANGVATFTLSDGTYTVDVSASGYETTSQSLTINGADNSLDFSLTTATSTGTTDGTVTLDGEDWTIWSEGRTTATVESGAVELDVNEVGDAFWKTQFYKEGITVPGAGRYLVTFEAKSNVPRDIRLEVAPTGAAVSPGQFDFRLTDTMQTYQASFEFSGLTTAPLYKLNFCLGAISDASLASTVTIDNVKVTSGTALSTSSLTVNLTDGTAALEGATVSIKQTNTATPLTTDALGNAVFNLENRQYTVEANLAGYQKASKTIVLSGDTTINLTLEEIQATTDPVYLYATDGIPSGAIDLVGSLDTWGTGTTQNLSYADDTDYNPCISIQYGSGWGNVLAYNEIEAGSLAGYDTMKLKVKTSDYPMILVQLTGADTPEFPYDLTTSDSNYTIIDLGNGWKELTIDLARYGDLSGVTQLAIHNNSADQTAGMEILLTDIYFESAQ
ncbi:carboxypeptidase regulatory-like domain-containing protein [Orenia marismortui]|uniref:carboxypeptidase regulatory-like domain-containing protein n=1 Tax=Orenia marismortui TaxID=46469 RepID=UPI00035C2907|nr:carboxypeptidase regulatory-like domain-containing protein [Orenia marismortui]